MEINRQGVTRIVLLIGNYAIKIPNFTCQHNHFLQGCYANWSERQLSINAKLFPDEDKLQGKFAPSYFCSWFGLIQIQARCEPCKNDLSDAQIKEYEPLCGTDFKKENFGYYNNKLVCLDYP